MLRRVGSLGAILLLLLTAHETKAATCNHPKAEAGFAFRNDQRSANPFAGDSGIVPDGFVEIADVKAVHGVDVSKYENQIDFTRAVECGARFVYVRLSAGSRRDNELEYRTLWLNARGALRNERGFVGGYHNLSFLEPAGSSGFSRLSVSSRTAWAKKNEEISRLQGRILIERLREVLGLDAIADCQITATDLGCPFLPIALDLSTRPQIKGTIRDKEAYGREVYGPSICAWIDEVRSKALGSKPLLLFVAPDTYSEFKLQDAPCPIKELPVWIRDHGPTGGLPGAGLSARQSELVGSLCNAKQLRSAEGADRNARCLFHQYTSFGGFAVFNPDAALDLNRFYGTIDSLRGMQQTISR